MGDWLRAAGYETQYRGKWHVSHADLLIPGTHEGLRTSDDSGRPFADAVEVYGKADPLVCRPSGLSGAIKEPVAADGGGSTD